MRIGCHLSASKGFYHMGKEAESIGANCFQFFTRNPRGGKAKELDLGDIGKFLVFARERDIESLLAHAPYTLNPCAKDKSIRKFTYEIMMDDLMRLEHLPGCMYNFHPGSHVKQGAEAGIEMIAEMLDRLAEGKFKTKILLETMAGKGTEIGRSFEELGRIIELTQDSSRIGICLDTCHIYDGGYDIVHNLDGVLTLFDEIIGLKRLSAIHLNDSKNPFNSHKDRHEKIGKGSIGLTGFTALINHPKLRHLPFYLETPNELEGYAQEIALLKECYLDMD